MFFIWLYILNRKAQVPVHMVRMRITWESHENLHRHPSLELLQWPCPVQNCLRSVHINYWFSPVLSSQTCLICLLSVCLLWLSSPTFPLELSDLHSSLVFFLYTSKTFLSLCSRVLPHPQCCLLFVEEGLVVGVTVTLMLFSMLITVSPESVSLLLCLPGLRRPLPHCDWQLLIEMSYLRQNSSFSVLHLSPLQCPICLCVSPHIWLHPPSRHQLD